MPLQWHAAPCRSNGMLPHAAPMACPPMPPHAFLMACRPNAMPPLVFPLACYPMPPQYPRPTHLHHVLPIPVILVPITQNTPQLPISTLGPPVCITAKRPSAHPSISCHSLLLILVLNPTHCPSAHLYTVCNHNTINPSPCTIHPPAHPSASGRAHFM